MGLAHTAGANQHDVFMAVDKAQASQILELTSLDAFGKVITEVRSGF